MLCSVGDKEQARNKECVLKLPGAGVAPLPYLPLPWAFMTTGLHVAFVQRTRGQRLRSPDSGWSGPLHAHQALPPRGRVSEGAPGTQPLCERGQKKKKVLC